MSQDLYIDVSTGNDGGTVTAALRKLPSLSHSEVVALRAQLIEHRKAATEKWARL